MVLRVCPIAHVMLTASCTELMCARRRHFSTQTARVGWEGYILFALCVCTSHQSAIEATSHLPTTLSLLYCCIVALCGALRGHGSCALQQQRLAESTRVLHSTAAPCCEHWGARRSIGVQKEGRDPILAYCPCSTPSPYIWFLWYQRGRTPLQPQSWGLLRELRGAAFGFREAVVFCWNHGNCCGGAWSGRAPAGRSGCRWRGWSRGCRRGGRR